MITFCEEHDEPHDMEIGCPYCNNEKEIARLRAEIEALRTGDTCARQCEGTAYRIEARNLKRENAELAALIESKRGEIDYFSSELKRANALITSKDALIETQKMAIALSQQHRNSIAESLKAANALIDQARVMAGYYQYMPLADSIYIWGDWRLFLARDFLVAVERHIKPETAVPTL